MRRPPRNPTIVVTVAVAAAVGVWAVRGGLGSSSAGGGQRTEAGSPVVARIAVDDSPRQAVLAADGLWVIGERALYRIDPSSNRVVATIPVGTVVAAPAAVALAGGAAWVPAVASTTLWRVDRAQRHGLFEDWILNQVVPFIHHDCGGPLDIMVTGSSFGAYHAANFAFRRADLFPFALCQSGVYDAGRLGWGERGDALYFNNPTDYVANLHGDHLEWLRGRLLLLLVCGQG